MWSFSSKFSGLNCMCINSSWPRANKVYAIKARQERFTKKTQSFLLRQLQLCLSNLVCFMFTATDHVKNPTNSHLSCPESLVSARCVLLRYRCSMYVKKTFLRRRKLQLQLNWEEWLKVSKLSFGDEWINCWFSFVLQQVRPRYHCLRFQILHSIYSQFSSLTSC